MPYPHICYLESFISVTSNLHSTNTKCIINDGSERHFLI